MSLFKKIFPDLYSRRQAEPKELVDMEQRYLGRNLMENKNSLQEIFGNSFDFTVSEIKFSNKKGYMIYLQSMVNPNEINDRIVQKINELNQANKIIITDADLVSVKDDFFSGLLMRISNEYRRLISDLLNGNVLILIDRHQQALSISIEGVETRSIQEPSTQTIIRGPKDAFTESLSTNMSLLRRRIKNPKLQFENYVLGTDTRTMVVLAYLGGVVNKGIVEEARKRINAIEVNAVLDSGNIEEVITDHSYTPFPLTFNTERPDVIAAGILEGKIGIIVDGSPFVLLIPAVLTDFFQSSEDYYQPYFMSSFIRIIRYISFMISLILPAIYVSIVTYHHELIPTELLISIQAQREGVPFPAVIEILIMEITFEILREAGVRMPRAVGQTVSIVGALVIGQAAVEAGLVSNVLVIVVAFTAIASFVSPIYNFSISTRLLRFVLVFAAALCGLYGILLFLIFMVAHLVSLRSFGVPYLSPVAPFIVEDQKDVFVRFPAWSNKIRPTYLKPEKLVRNEKTHQPVPPEKGEKS
ncbi:spore germination protein [Pseudoneobacillus sp. C159]